MSKKIGYSNGLLLGHIELTPKQEKFQKIMTNPKTRVVFVSGPAGTSKTFLSVYCALKIYNEKPETKILYLRSVIESANKGLGFLKGDIDDKFSPYLGPLKDKVDELLNDPEKYTLEQKKVLNAEPINFMRGQTWRDKVVIIDEAQNCTFAELQTLLTRIGDGATVFVCGDLMQSDIRSSGFEMMISLFEDKESERNGIYSLKFDKKDIKRDKIIGFLLKRMEKVIF